MEVPPLSDFRIFEARPGAQAEIEEAVEKYLNDHPNMVIKDFQLAVTQYNIYLAVLFTLGYLDLPMFVEKQQQLPARPTEITCDDDPWKGEFIPVGDPPKRLPFGTPGPGVVTGRNVMEQFGASYH